MSAVKDQRVKLSIPFSIMDIIDHLVSIRVADGETNVTRTSVALEMLKIGARVKKKEIERIETGGNPFDNRGEEQLSFIAHKVARMDLSLRRLNSIVTHHFELDKDLVQRVKESVDISDDELNVIKRLFIEIAELKDEFDKFKR
jgi:hypothetical protein